MKLKLRSSVSFLASIFNGTGTAVRKDGLATYVDLDYDSLEAITSFDPSTKQIAVNDSNTGEWNKTTLSDLLSLSGYVATSLSPATIGLGSVSFTTQAGLAYREGARVRASSRADTSNYMEGLVTSYSGTTLTVDVSLVSGSGSHSDWNLSLAGDPGAGDMLSTNNGLDFSDIPTTLNNLGGVSFSDVQSLSDAEKVQARQNIGASGAAVYVEDFVEAGDTDDTESFQRAIDTGKTVLALGNSYTISGNLFVDLESTGNLCLIGGGPGVTTILFNGSGVFLHAYTTDNFGAYTEQIPSVLVSGFTIRKNGAGLSDTGIKIELLDEPIIGGSNEVFWREVSDIQFLPGPSGESLNNFNVGIEWVNPSYSTTKRVVFRGIGNVETAVLYSGDRPCGDNFIEDLKAVACLAVVNSTSTGMEGLYISHIVGVSVTYGIAWVPATPKPLLQVSGAHFNVTTNAGIGIWYGGNSLHISDSLIYCAGTSSFGIYIAPNSPTIAMPRFSGVTIVKTGGSVTGVHLGANAGAIMLSGLTFYGLDLGISNAAALPVTVAPDVQFISVGTKALGTWSPPASSLLLEEVASSSVSSAANAINTSGKVRGKLILVPDGASPGLYFASSSTTTGGWFLSNNFATVITPA